MGKSRKLAEKATGPLSGIRVLDLTSVVNGAYGAQILADQGADVIKLEDPGSGRGDGGDIMRWAGHPPEGAPRGMGPIYLTINRNKRSMLLDLGDARSRKTLIKLIKTCDVFAASVRYAGLKRLGLSYEDVAAIKPDIVYVHCAGYGSDGPYAGEPAYDDLIQSASGLADLMPRTDGNPTPRLLPTLVADTGSGLFLSQAITAALLSRATTGQGQFVEVPMLECVTSFTLSNISMTKALNRLPASGPISGWPIPTVNPIRPGTAISAFCPIPTNNGTSSLPPPAWARPLARTHGFLTMRRGARISASSMPWWKL